MGDIEARIQVLSPKAGDAIAVSMERILTVEQREKLHEALKARLPEGVKTMILEGGATLAHVESPEAATERHELLCEVKALREDIRLMRRQLADLTACGAHLAQHD